MARNVSRTFATMDDDERRRFALEEPQKQSDEEIAELEFPEDDPRNLPPGDEKRDGGARD
jgi:hypothetical protein